MTFRPTLKGCHSLDRLAVLASGSLEHGGVADFRHVADNAEVSGDGGEVDIKISKVLRFFRVCQDDAVFSSPCFLTLHLCESIFNLINQCFPS